jgi:tetratricopeptide (TPR) repeat protein
MNKKKLEAEDFFKLAFENHKKNNLQNAENLYKDAIKQKPDHINSIFYLAGLLAQKKNFNEAKELFEKVVDLNPKYPSAKDNLCAIYKMLANISSQHGDLLEAKKLFEKALILNPNNQEINHVYGVLLLKLNSHAKGLDHIKKGTGFIRFSSESYKII